jgi:hypothetical protein
MASSSHHKSVYQQIVNDANALADVGRESTADTFTHGIDREGGKCVGKDNQSEGQKPDMKQKDHDDVRRRVNVEGDIIHLRSQPKNK